MILDLWTLPGSPSCCMNSIELDRIYRDEEDTVTCGRIVRMLTSGTLPSPFSSRPVGQPHLIAMEWVSEEEGMVKHSISQLPLLVRASYSYCNDERILSKDRS